MFVYTGACVPLMVLKQSSQLCIASSLDEHLHVQLSNASFMARYVICMIWLIFYHLFPYNSFCRDGLKNPKGKE